MTELKITKEKVLAAAAKCSTAKETLKTLFPEAFDDGFKIHPKHARTNLVDDVNGCPIIGFAIGIAKSYGEPGLSEKCFWLDGGSYNWELLPENGTGYQLLVPTKK